MNYQPETPNRVWSEAVDRLIDRAQAETNVEAENRAASKYANLTFEQARRVARAIFTDDEDTSRAFVEHRKPWEMLADHLQSRIREICEARAVECARIMRFEDHKQMTQEVSELLNELIGELGRIETIQRFVCKRCGYEGKDSDWTSMNGNGDTPDYKLLCPGCGVIDDDQLDEIARCSHCDAEADEAHLCSQGGMI